MTFLGWLLPDQTTVATSYRELIQYRFTLQVQAWSGEARKGKFILTDAVPD